LSPKLTKLIVAAVSFVVATLSWKFVEEPFRGRPFRISRVAVFRFGATAAVVLLILGTGIVASGGVPSRYPSEAVKVAAFLQNSDAVTKAQYRVGSCFLTSADTYEEFNPASCLRTDPIKRNYLLVGDSHAAQLWYGLSSVFPGVNLMQATASGCKPTLEQDRVVDEKCHRLMKYIFTDFLPSHHVDTLLIAARWDGGDLPRLEHTLEWARHQGMGVVLFGPIVQYDSALPRLLAFSIKRNDPGIASDHRIAYYERLDGDMAKLAEAESVRYVSYFKLLCQQGSCLEYASAGIPLQSDYGHLTGGGSLLIAAKIREIGALN
jgi:hypothetical protein